MSSKAWLDFHALRLYIRESRSWFTPSLHVARSHFRVLWPLTASFQPCFYTREESSRVVDGLAMNGRLSLSHKPTR